MKYVRLLSDGLTRYGILTEDQIHLIDTTPFEEFRRTGQVVPLEGAHLLAPTDFSKAICIGLNYRDHAEELQLAIPDTPVVFLKPSTTSLAPGERIIKPKMCSRLDYEAELCVVIKKEAHFVSTEEAFSYILGYTIANDVTARDLQPKQGQWTVAKGFDTFCPFGPFISDEVDPSNLAIESRVNGELRQSSNTKNLIFTVPYLVSYLSHVMTLLPGDIILTGTPSGIGPMEKGDTVEITIEGLGTLSNPIA
ncbi:MAG TPA: fumarylacetoacetate hydrolase family protein [Sphaerochaeta sp.]|nr:fumarylacetoacetate hydrolase family protein [Sphaerochaeta sp.]